ncbi:MAG: putative rane protein [Fibrobacteria bacterium]|nr:putative rane protein [Fibrobacteria bacterium]
MYFIAMRLHILLSLFAFSLLLGGLNNAVNPEGVPWSGSPRVLPKPEGWPTLTMAQGIQAGVKHAADQARENAGLLIAALALLAGGWVVLRLRGRAPARWIKSWWRLVFAAMFLTAAWSKFLDPRGFAMLVAQYQMLPEFSVHLFSVWLPAFEITVGLALLAQALYRGLGIACGCFDLAGATDAGESWFALLRDIVLLVPIAWMWVRAEDRALWKV